MKLHDPMTFMSRIFQALRSPDTSQPFQRLAPFNWGGELLVACGGMLVSLLCGLYHNTQRVEHLPVCK
jgi:hypothetical protein